MRRGTVPWDWTAVDLGATMPKFQISSMHAPIQLASRQSQQQKWDFQEQVHGKGPDPCPIDARVRS